MAVLVAHATKRVAPEYPPIAKAAHVGGVVTVGLEIDAAGKITTAVILNGPEMLRAAALDAAKQWEFSPIEVDGKPTTVRSAIQLKFAAFTGSTSY